MKEYIRELSSSDIDIVKTIDTDIEDDYVIRVFDRLTSGENRIFGLFLDNQIVSTAGYTLYAGSYAMLGRLRSDLRFRGNNYATKLMAYVRDIAFGLPGIKWVGGNTQENNLPARKVLTNIGLEKQEMLYPATTKNIEGLLKGDTTWSLISDRAEKKQRLSDAYVPSSKVFTYECYYPFPGTEDLFRDEQIKDWNVYTSTHNTYPIVTKKDIKKYTYLQVNYPFSDVFTSEGIWETINHDYKDLQSMHPDEEVYVWLDIPEKFINQLPPNHPFEFESPWILHGMYVDEWKQQQVEGNKILSKTK